MGLKLCIHAQWFYLCLGSVLGWQGLVPTTCSCSLLFCTSLSWEKCQCSCPHWGGSFPAAPFLLPEQKRDIYDRYGKDGLMGAGEQGPGGWCSSVHPCLKTQGGSVPPGLPTLQGRCHPGLHLTLSSLQQEQAAPGPVLGPPNSPSPSAVLTTSSGSSLVDETPLLNSLVCVGQGRLALGHLSVCGAAAEPGDRAHGWPWQRVPTSVPCFWFTKLME